MSAFGSFRREDPLAALLRRRESAVSAVRAVALTGAVAAIGALAGWRDGLAVLAASLVVLAVAGFRALALSFEAHDRTLRRIGSGDVASAPDEVARVRARLLEPRHRERLAHRLERVGDTPSAPGARPPVNRRAVAETRRELAAVADALRSPAAAPSGVAAAQRLLCDAGSALYGADPARLREELRRIAFLLAG
jgi:hypothetical protein